jgi:Type II secretion system (T2SS), protein E, N-terminal domain
MSGKLKLKPGAPGRDEPGTDALESDERTATLEHLGIVAPAGDGAITPLGALLVERGDLSGQQLRDALGAQTSGGKRLGEILVELGVISERVLSSALAEQVGLEAIDLSRARPDIAIVGLMPEDEARALGALPLRKVGERIEVAIADPLDRELQSKLIALLHAPVRLLVAPLADINYAIDRAYLNLAEISGALREFEQRSEARGRITGTTAEVAVDANAPIVKVVNLIFEQAVRDRGSDVHIEPQQDRVRVRVRSSCIWRCSNRTGSTNGFGWNRSEKGDAATESRDRHHVGHLARRRGRRSSRGVTGPSRGGPGHPIPRA